jgi:hypothetical protein
MLLSERLVSVSWKDIDMSGPQLGDSAGMIHWPAGGDCVSSGRKLNWINVSICLYISHPYLAVFPRSSSLTLSVVFIPPSLSSCLRERSTSGMWYIERLGSISLLGECPLGLDDPSWTGGLCHRVRPQE